MRYLECVDERGVRDIQEISFLMLILHPAACYEMGMRENLPCNCVDHVGPDFVGDERDNPDAITKTEQ